MCVLPIRELAQREKLSVEPQIQCPLWRSMCHGAPALPPFRTASPALVNQSHRYQGVR